VALPGGGPANVAIGLARLGARSVFAGRLSRYGFGPWLSQHLASNGVDLSLSVDAPENATLAVVTLDQQGRATYTFYSPDTSDWQWQESELPFPLPETFVAHGLAAVHTGSLALAYEPCGPVLAGWLAKLRRQTDVAISIDPNVRPAPGSDVDVYRRRLEDVISSSHIVKASVDDVEAMYPGKPAREAVDRWMAAGASLVVLTEGAEGATAFHSGGFRSHVRAPRIEVADTIGAGDAFSAGLLAFFAEHGLLSPAGVAQAAAADLEAALAEAIAISAYTCTRPGADPPTRDALQSFVAAHR